jgi:hypothetical protein
MVVGSGLPRALKLSEFASSVELLAWANGYGYPWVARTSAVIARHGNMQVLGWARVHDCPWDAFTCGAPLRAGTCTCWCGRRSTGARGLTKCVKLYEQTQKQKAWTNLRLR